MTDAERELLYDLLAKKVTEGLDAEEQKQLESYDPAIVKAELRALETTAAAIGMAAIDIEPMPEHLFARIADSFSAAIEKKAAEFDGGATIPSMAPVFTADDVFERKPRTFVFALLGWLTAVVLLVVLGLQLYSDRRIEQPQRAAVTPLPAPSQDLGVAQQRDELLRTAPDAITATWAPGNMKDLDVTGDVVWSDAKQQGFIRLYGLPPNDVTKTCYQLWIFDKTQDPATPIDGGIFDVDANGDLIVPIHASLEAVKPEMFALTVERHGGVMVSKREKIAALAKVETQKS